MKSLIRIGIVVAALAGIAFADELAVPEYIVESRTGGLNFDKYSDAGLAESTAKSTAAGCTLGIGSKYGSLIAGKYGLYSFTPLANGRYQVFATWGQSTNGYTIVDHIVVYEAGTVTKQMNQNQSSALYNKWNSLGTYEFVANTNYTVKQLYTTAGGAGTRIMCDAVKWTIVGPSCLDVPNVSIEGPLVAGDTIVHVKNISNTPGSVATLVSVYANRTGPAIGSIDPAGATEVDVPVTALVHNDQINATQTMPVSGTSTEGCIMLTGPIVDKCDQIGAVSIGSILMPGGTTVRVTGVATSNVTAVTVYGNAGALGSNTSPGTTGTVDVTVTALTSPDTIKATQTIKNRQDRTLEGCVPTSGKAVGNCNQIPHVRIVGIVDVGRTLIRVTDVASNASAVAVYDSANALLGSNGTPGGASTVVVSVTALAAGQSIKATQTIKSIEGVALEGCKSGAPARRVMAAGIIDDFEDGVVASNSPFPTGSPRVWYDVSDIAYSDALLTTGVSPFVDKALRSYDGGWTNGIYAVYDQVIPESKEYHLELDMLIDESGATADTDMFGTYRVGVKVNGTHRANPGLLASIASPIGEYWGLDATQNGVGIDTEVQKVYTEKFAGTAGDNLLIAFSSDTDGYVLSKSPATGKVAPPGMLIDNIKLVEGDPPITCRSVTKVAVIKGPLEESGPKEVIVSNVSISPQASLVTVYETTFNTPPTPPTSVAIGSVAPNPGSQEVIVPVSALTKGKTISATQTVNGVEGCVLTTGPVAGSGKNSSLLLSLGIRENTALTGPIGADGGTTGAAIEWIGPSAAIGGSPQGYQIVPTGDWQTITFDPIAAAAASPKQILSFNAGNSILDGTFGVFEHLAAAIDSSAPDAGRYVMYIDNIKNGPPGSETLITDFESYSAGQMVMFNLPDFSGTTKPYLLPPVNVAQIDDTIGDGGTGKSLRIEFEFFDNTAKRWVRLTTAPAATAQPLINPQVNLSQPITMRILLKGTVGCGKVFADWDKDGDVDQIDFGAFQACFTGVAGGVLPGCGCFDHNGDNNVNATDYNSFAACWSGPSIPYVETCDDTP